MSDGSFWASLYPGLKWDSTQVCVQGPVSLNKAPGPKQVLSVQGWMGQTWILQAKTVLRVRRRRSQCFPAVSTRGDLAETVVLRVAAGTGDRGSQRGQIRLIHSGASSL